MPLKLMYITKDPAVACIAQKYGVDRIFVDLETRGKEERQKNMNTVKSNHTVEDVRNLASYLDKSELMARINPWYEGSQAEIDDVISAGADAIMLPMWKTPYEVEQFIKAVDSRVKTVLLLETKEAVECIDDVLVISGIDEVHIGLNDLHLSYGLRFMFELLSNGTVEMLCNKMKKAGIFYGFGGIARIGTGTLPSDLILSEHVRLGSRAVIVSRSFCDSLAIGDINEIERIFSTEIAKLRVAEAVLSRKSEEELLKAKEEVAVCIKNMLND